MIIQSWIYNIGWLADFGQTLWFTIILMDILKRRSVWEMEGIENKTSYRLEYRWNG